MGVAVPALMGLRFVERKGPIMSLGINTQASGDFKPYIKYDARAGRIFRAPNKEAGEQNAVDITMSFVGLMDLQHIKVGWLDFPTGAAPDYQVQDVSKGLPQKPAGGKHKQGFVLSVMLPGDPQVYEMASSSKATVESFNVLHDAFINAPEAKTGQLPIVKMVNTLIVETQSKNGTTRNYQPVWQITGWNPRPAAMPAGVTGNAPPANAVQGSPAPTGAQTFATPAAATTTQQTSAPPAFG